MIDQTNFETWFFMYADNELSANERLQVEEFVRNNPSSFKLFELINQIKFHPEKVAFPDKTDLYADQISLTGLTFEADLSITYPSKSTLYKKAPSEKTNGYLSFAIAASVIALIGLFILFKQETKTTLSFPLAKTAIEDSSFEPKPEVLSIASASLNSQSKKDISSLYLTKVKELPTEPFMPTGEQSDSETIVENGSDDAVVVAPAAQSNLSEEVLRAAESRMAMSAQDEQNSVAINTEMIIEATTRVNEQGRLRVLVRKLSRKIFKEKEMSDQEKLIQVASFAIPVSNKK